MAINHWKKNFKKKESSGKTASQKAELKKQIDALELYISAQGGVVDQLIFDKLAKYKAEYSPNVKHHATKAYEDGIEFDSNLERSFYRMLKASGYEFEKDFFYQKHFELQPAFKLHGTAIRSINIYVDFIIGGCVLVDTKGLATEEWKIKWKILKHQQGENFHYFMPGNKLQCEEVIRQIKFIIKSNG